MIIVKKNSIWYDFQGSRNMILLIYLNDKLSVTYVM